MSRLFFRIAPALFFSLFFACRALAGADSFRTDEYRASTGLESIQAAEAYALGFTGKGVTVGVVDSGFAGQSGEFLGKYPYGSFWFGALQADEDDPYPEEHGIHVNGIIAAAKDNRGMHGVAYDAMLLPLAGVGTSDDGGTEKAWAALLEFPEVRIINNSLGNNFHLDTPYTDFSEMLDSVYGEQITLMKALAAQDKLLVFAAGNEGHLAPSVDAGLPSALRQYRNDSGLLNNFISVAAYDPREPTDSPVFLAPFTNLGKGASDYTLLAPGVDIYSTAVHSQYKQLSGTSMAAPYVAGVAALAQEAFPYMGGKQLADVLLSTATPLSRERLPVFFALLEQEYAENGESEGYAFKLYGTAADSGSLAPEQLEKIIDSLQTMSDDGRPEIEQALRQNYEQLSETAFLELFGQGMVNARKAVLGPGGFNANRLDPVADLADNAFGDGNKYAMYSVDTKGYASVWGNDIGETQAKSGPLANLGVGLRKDGPGTLYLTGANTYSGPTEVRDGGLSLGTPDNYARASVAGDVYVRDNGYFMGAGVIGGSLHSTGVLAPGFYSVPGTALKVEGGVTSAGELRFILGQNGLGNKMIAGQRMDLTGCRLEIVEAVGHELDPYVNYHDVLVAEGGITGLPGGAGGPAARSAAAGPPSIIVFSPFLSYTPLITDGRSLSLIADTKSLDSLPGLPPQTRAVAGALQHMFTGLRVRGNPLQDQLDFLYSMDAGSFEEAVSAMRGDIQAATLTGLPFTGMLQKLVSSNPLGTRQTPARERPEEFSPSPGSGSGGVNVWMRPLAGYSNTDGTSSIRQAAVSSHMRGLAIGLQRDAGNFYGGALFAIGDSEMEQGGNEADIIDARLGLYGGFATGGLRLAGLVSGGWQHYKTGRRVPTGNGNAYLKSRFDGYSLGFGAEASYNLLHGYGEKFALSPYAGFDADYIRQDGRKESGSDVFILDVDGKNYWRTAARPGLRLDFFPVEWLTVTAAGGYKRLLSGHKPSLWTWASRRTPPTVSAPLGLTRAAIS